MKIIAKHADKFRPLTLLYPLALHANITKRRAAGNTLAAKETQNEDHVTKSEKDSNKVMHVARP